MKKLLPLFAFGLVVLFVSESQAGRIPGPGIDVKIVQARSSVTYNELFRGGQIGSVTIRGDGTTDVDIYVYDEFGQRVAQAIGLSDNETATFFVPRTGRYRIVIRNLGTVWNRVEVTTN